MLIVVAPRRSSIRMSQGDTGAPCAASATAMNSFPVFLACASAAPGMPTAVAKRRHLCTRFAFNPCAIATAATDAPACAHCANTRDFSSTLCLRLGSRLDSCMVPTSFVGGHHLRYQRIRLQYATARRLRFGQRPVLATQIGLTRTAKRLAPLFQLMLEQAFLPAPGVKCGQQTLRGAPVLGGSVAGQARQGC